MAKKAPAPVVEDVVEVDKPFADMTPAPEPKRRSIALQFHQNIAPPSSQSKVTTGAAPHPDDAGKGVR